MTQAAPLTAIDTAPIPPGGGAEWFTGAGGARLRAALFTPPGRPRGSVVLSTGRTEPIEKYFEVIGELLDRGFVVLANEWRGQGLSHRDLPDRLPGHIGRLRDWIDDFAALLTAFEARLPKPWIAMAHSMGGAITLAALARGQASRFAGAIFSAPMIGIRLGGIPRHVAVALALFNVLTGKGGAHTFAGPGQPMGAPFETNVLTHDRARYERMQAQLRANPELALGGITWGWLRNSLKLIGELARPSVRKALTLPVVICSAGEEALVDNAAQEALAASLPQGTFISIPGARHEILMETDPYRKAFWDAFDALAGKVAPAA